MRPQVTYENRSANFYLRQEKFEKQFCHIYTSRLLELGSEIKAKAEKKFGKEMITWDHE